MHCLACNVLLTEAESLRKYANHEEIKNPEDKYILLCDKCLCGAELEDEELESVLHDFVPLSDIEDD